jgi:hypothetical protein
MSLRLAHPLSLKGLPMTQDPAYLANVSSALMGALHEAQDMVDAGERGPPLVDVVRHARELHEIMMEELGNRGRGVAEQAVRALAETGERLRSLERAITVAP